MIYITKVNIADVMYVIGIIYVIMNNSVVTVAFATDNIIRMYYTVLIKKNAKIYLD